jgi:hypothetical protein
MDSKVRTGRATRVLATAAMLALLVVGLLAGSVFAAKGGGSKPSGGGGSSLALVMVTDANGNGQPNWADQVTFTVSTSVSQPSVKLSCSQGGVVVAYGSAGFYPGYPWPWAQTFTLSSGAWTGGAADCTATLYYYNGRSYPTLATLTFRAEA